MKTPSKQHQPLLLWTVTTWTVISNTSKNAKTRKNLEGSYIALWKPDLNEQNNFERIVLSRDSVT